MINKGWRVWDMDIYLKKAVLHIVDREAGDPVYSQKEMDLTREYTRDYLTKKIQKLPSTHTKTGVLTEGSVFAKLCQQTKDDFSLSSIKIVRRWYETYRESEEAPSASVFIALYEEDTQLYLALLKVNFQEGYTNIIENGDGGTNELIIHRALLSGKSKKADEGIIVNLENLNYEMTEKKYLFSGEKQLYFSTKVIESVPDPSLDENISVIKKVAGKIGAKFENSTHDVIADIKEAVYDLVEESGQIDAKVVAQKVFKDNISAQQSFQEEVVENGYIDQVSVSKEVREIVEKKYAKQKLKLSNGIELTVPIDVYRNPDLIEFNNNPDGTISVSIKNVDEVINQM